MAKSWTSKNSSLRWINAAGMALLIGYAGCTPTPQPVLTKVRCRALHGNGREEPMSAWKYDRVRQMIVDEVNAAGGEMDYKPLRHAAAARFTAEETETIGTPIWFVETVSLEMECRGELQRTTDTDRRFPAAVRLVLDSPAAP